MLPDNTALWYSKLEQIVSEFGGTRELYLRVLLISVRIILYEYKTSTILPVVDETYTAKRHPEA